MIKYYCDGCGNELDRNYVSEKLLIKDAIGDPPCTYGIQVQAGRSNDGVSVLWNAGELCRGCLIHLIVEGIDWTT